MCQLGLPLRGYMRSLCAGIAPPPTSSISVSSAANAKTEELAQLGDAIREAETTGNPVEGRPEQTDCETHPEKSTNGHQSDAAAALRLLILTGRLREILSLK
jgi:hypothetical protein